SLHWSIGPVHNDAGQAIDGRKAQREILAPPFACGPNQEPRHAVCAVEYIQRRRYLATAVRHDAHFAREQLRQRVQIARACCRYECGYELLMLGIDRARMRRRRNAAAWPYCAHVLSCASGQLPARRLT